MISSFTKFKYLMSNILIIKHGSLGDIAQISGVLRDIRENYLNKKIFILTTSPYAELLSKCPYVDAVLIDKRLPRWNLLYLFKLQKIIKKFNFTHIFDLQNSSRTSFYRKFLIKNYIWNSAETSLNSGERKKDFDHLPVLERFKMQLDRSNINSKNVLNPDFQWSAVNVETIINKYFKGNFVLIFPFCSPQLPKKKWPYFNDLIDLIKLKHGDLEVVTAPSHNEFNEAKKINAKIITNQNKSLNIMELAGLIKKASFIISNDTGPAHMSAHLGKKGVALFGPHTTSKKVSIETNNFKAINTDDLNQLKAEDVYSNIKDTIDLID